MKFYYVTTDPIFYKNNENQLIDSTKRAIEAESHIFDGKSKKNVRVFKTEADAIEWARYGVDPAYQAQHAVITLNSNITNLELLNTPISDNAKIEVEGEPDKIIPSYTFPAYRFFAIKASFKYADQEAKDIALHESAKKRFHDELDKALAEIQTAKRQLTLDEGSPIVAKLNEMLAKAPVPHFDENGEEPADRLVVATWGKELLTQLARTKDNSAEIERSLLKGAQDDLTSIKMHR